MQTKIQLKKLLSLAFILIAFVASAQRNVLTQHNNNFRTGWYSNEKILNKTNVHSGSFGKIFTRAVDDQIYAQPLVKLNLNLPNVGAKNVVFVATVKNTIYAFDADSANVTTPYWKINLTPANSRVINKNDETGACGGFYNDFSGNMGIVGTPVIDSASNTMYVVARSVDTSVNPKSFKQYLHAIDIKTGAEKANSPILIAASVTGTGDGSVNGKVSFNALHNNQRSGLLLINNIVYITWSSHCDWGPYHGWLMGYNKNSLQQTAVYATTPYGYNGGIWMSGGGPSADSAGNIYLAVGNGSVGYGGNPSDLRNRSETALKLSPNATDFTIKSFFTPKNYETLEGADLDFGVTQIMLIPNTNRAIVGVKDGHIYLLDRTDLGGYNNTTDNVVQTIDLGSNSFLRSAMSYYKGNNKEFVYSWSENSLLRAYPFNRTTKKLDVDQAVISGIQGPTGNNGALLSVSSNGSKDGTAILWATYAASGDANQSVRPGILRAIDASDVTKELWNSSANANDNPGNYAKFNCPTIANGKVYLATFSNQLVVYGLTGKAIDTCNSANIALNKPAFASSIQGANFTAAKANDGSLSTAWVSKPTNNQNIFIDLGQRYDLCNVMLHWQSAAKDFKIEVSDDTIHWTDAEVVTGNTDADNSIAIKASGRYVGVFATQRNNAGGYALYEFEVYGKISKSGCSVPVNLSANNVYETQATLHWDNNGALKYIVQYKTVTAVEWTRVTTPKSNITLTDLSCNTPYQFRVQAKCDSKDSSGYSIASGFTTLECDINCDPLPTRWSTQDIGDVGLPGAACYNGSTGTFELKGSGADIWDNADAFRFAYKTIVGDGEIVARVVDQDATDVWNKCGIMVRQSFAEGSRNAFIAITSGNGVAFQYRQTTDGSSFSDFTGAGIKAPYWLKMVISGTTYTGYRSPDGLTWTKVGNTVDLGFGGGSPVYAGLAITSHNNSVLSTAHVDNYNLGSLGLAKLISFNSSQSLNHTVNLDWITTRETRTNYFIVERTKDFWNYTSIDTVYAENNGEFTQNYDATDKHPAEGNSYYRIKIVDMDGKVSYSPVAAAKLSNAVSPTMYPNPANTYVNIAKGTDAIKQITIYNIVGRTVLRIPNGGGESTIKIPTYSLASGLYFVEIRTANSVYRDKLVKTN